MLVHMVLVLVRVLVLVLEQLLGLVMGLLNISFQYKNVLYWRRERPSLIRICSSFHLIHNLGYRTHYTLYLDDPGFYSASTAPVL